METEKHSKIYRGFAKYYDLIESYKNYKKETEYLKKLISKYKKSSGKNLLEVACGTGNYLKYLKNSFNCTGTDISEEMLKIAKRKVKGVNLQKSDMIKLNINKKFEIILCLFASIGFIKTYPNLRKTINNFSNHLNKGGVVIIDPWQTKSTYKPESIHITNYNGKEEKMTRLTIYKLKNNISVIDTQYLIVKKGGKIQHIVDKLEIGLFDIKKTLQFMEESGLQSKFLKNEGFGRGLFIGIKS